MRLTSYLNEAKTKIQFKATNALSDGLKHGAEDFMLDVSDARKAYVKTRYVKKFDETAYKLGYDIANNQKFAGFYRSKQFLIKKAIDTGKIEPTDWELYQNSLGQYSIEQL
jgi:hypothetical protein